MTVASCRTVITPAGTKTRPHRLPYRSVYCEIATCGLTSRRSDPRIRTTTDGCRWSIRTIAVGFGNTNSISQPTLISILISMEWKSGQGQPALDVSHDHKDQHDNNQQPDSAAGPVTPLAAVAPGGQAAQKHQNQNNDQNCT